MREVNVNTEQAYGDTAQRLSEYKRKEVIANEGKTEGDFWLTDGVVFEAVPKVIANKGK